MCFQPWFFFFPESCLRAPFTSAVKLLNHERVSGPVVDALRREATSMAAMRHPHIVTIMVWI